MCMAANDSKEMNLRTLLNSAKGRRSPSPVTQEKSRVRSCTHSTFSKASLCYFLPDLDLKVQNFASGQERDFCIDNLVRSLEGSKERLISRESS